MTHDNIRIDPAGPTATQPHVEQVNRALLAHVRHELRTPVNAIIGYSEMLLEDAANLTHQRFFAELQHVHSLGKQLLALLNDHLDASRIEGVTSDLDLRALSTSVRQLLHIPSNEVIDSCDSLLTQADQARLDEFIPDLQRIRAAGVSLFALNEDVFDFGHRVPGAGKRSGTDLGVVLGLPPAPADDLGSADGSATGRAGHVLIVDDSDFNRDILARGLYRQGHHFALARNGQQALELIAAHAFDMVLLDIMMPGLNGIQVLEHLKADPKLRHLPVIVIASLDEIDSVVRCIQMGADDYLPKPFNPVLLKARIGGCLEKKWLRDHQHLYLEQIQKGQERYDALLHGTLPEPIAAELAATNAVRPRRYDNVAILSAEVSGLGAYCDQHPPEEVGQALQQMAEAWGDVARRHGVERVRTTGDTFLAAGGLFQPTDSPILDCVHCALELIAMGQALAGRWGVRVGIHAGPAVAGVLGRRPYQFGLWGETVDTATQVARASRPGTVTLSGAAWQPIERQCRGESVEAGDGTEKLELVRFEAFRA
jgi:CheY-like chemotaxis protein